MALHKKNWFKYTKNLIIGVGASIVMLGALGKINSYEWGSLAITAGLTTEAIIFLILGLIPPEKDYYWDKLYPGLGDYHSRVAPITGEVEGDFRQLNADRVESSLGGMLDELQTMSKSLGSLKALQEVDFSQTKDQIQSMNNFYDKMNEATRNIAEAVEDTEQYKAQLVSLNTNMTNMNAVYTSLLGHYERMNESVSNISETLEDTQQYKEQLASLNRNLGSLNTVYGNVLSAFSGRD